MPDLFQQEKKDIVITITVKEGDGELMDISYGIENMLTMQDAATVASVFDKSKAMIFQLLHENMPKQVKKLSKLDESQHIEYMKSQRLTFMLNGK